MSGIDPNAVPLTSDVRVKDGDDKWTAKGWKVTPPRAPDLFKAQWTTTCKCGRVIAACFCDATVWAHIRLRCEKCGQVSEIGEPLP